VCHVTTILKVLGQSGERRERVRIMESTDRIDDRAITIDRKNLEGSNPQHFRSFRSSFRSSDFAQAIATILITLLITLLSSSKLRFK